MWARQFLGMWARQFLEMEGSMVFRADETQKSNGDINCHCWHKLQVKRHEYGDWMTLQR